MKASEEDFTRWVDDELQGRDLQALEVQLGAEELADRQAARKLGQLLKQQGRAIQLTNCDFFNHGIIERIGREERAAEVPVAGRKFSWPRLIWAGAFCAMFAALLSQMVVKPSSGGATPEYVAHILATQTGDPGITATAFHSKSQDVTVLWLEGLDYLPKGSMQ